MKAICKKNTAKEIDLSEVTKIFSHEFRFPLIIEKEYIIMGLLINKKTNCIYYLTDESGLPSWDPYMLFDISDNELPPFWYVTILDKKTSTGNIFFLSGFDELCNNEGYHDLLISERDQNALDIYFKRKNEIQEWHWQKELLKSTNVQRENS